MDTVLQPRLTRVAEAELIRLRQLLEHKTLTDGDDVRVCPLENAKGQLRIVTLYRILMSAAMTESCSYDKFVWRNRAPPRVRFFAWLLVQDRIQSRHNL